MKTGKLSAPRLATGSVMGAVVLGVMLVGMGAGVRAAVGAVGEVPAAGTWWGLMWFGEREQRISIKLTLDKAGVWGGYLDLLRTDDRRLPVEEVVSEGAGGRDGTGMKFLVQMRGGKYVFDGLVDGYVVEGNYEGPGGVTGRFRAEREPPRTPRLQEPVGRVPYEVREVMVDGGDVKLPGTLTVPAVLPKGGAPAVLLLAGPNGRGRDQDAGGHKPFLVLADRLTRAGYVVLRYDDRTTVRQGLKSVKEARGDAAAALKFLRGREEVRADRVAVLGHSQGTSLAAELAAMDKGGADFLVMICGAGTRGLDTKPRQLSRTVMAMGVPPQYASQLVMREMAVYQAVVDGGAEALRSAVIALIALRNGDQREEIVDGEERFGRQATIEQAQYGSAWNQYYLTTDPKATLEKVTVPVLALNGARDVVNDSEETTPLLEDALRVRSRDHTVEVVPEMNHYMQTSRTGLISEVMSIEETVNEAMVKRLIEWLNGRAKM